MELHFRNVNDAFDRLVEIFREGPGSMPYGVLRRADSRNGPVLMVDGPATIVYSHPTERVLFNVARDANPFFHLYEALWMLAGRNDVAPLAYYNSRIAGFSDDGETFNGAYGYRWRNATLRTTNDCAAGDSLDQLELLINHLRADPDSRRAVLQMWNVEDDLLKIGSATGPPDGDCDTVSKDVCCNLCAMFSMRIVPGSAVEHPERQYTQIVSPHHVLDMTVVNRSNDLVWGMLGANYVQFTVLQEYIAAKLGVEVGRYVHFTNNLHVYETRPDWRPDEFLAQIVKESYADMVRFNRAADEYNASKDRSARPFPNPTVPLVADPARFDDVLPRFVEFHSRGKETYRFWSERFFDEVAEPMFHAYHHYKRDDLDAAAARADTIVADDWRMACVTWLEKRAERRAARG